MEPAMLKNHWVVFGVAALLALVLGTLSAGRSLAQEEKKEASKGKVLFIVASTHFYYQEYAEPKDELTKAGYDVEVTAYGSVCVPHEKSGQQGSGNTKVDVRPDQVDPSKYKAVVFVGGWGSSQYQYAYKGKYRNGSYNLNDVQKKKVNDIVSAFIDDKKPVGAICYGTTALAWSRDAQGNSPIKGKKSAAPALGGPACTGPDGKQYKDTELSSAQHIKDNGGTAVVKGDGEAPSNVVVDGLIITAQDNRTARAFGKAMIKSIQDNQTEKK
jgi:putative intracellular protease/amidase